SLDSFLLFPSGRMPHLPSLLLLFTFLIPSSALECHVSTKWNNHLAFSGSSICPDQTTFCYRKKTNGLEIASCAHQSYSCMKLLSKCKPDNAEECCCTDDNCNNGGAVVRISTAIVVAL
ncbi:hypothetical protein PFISCL1PPCAC_2747, partial [Pristionchus fissidentatus]